MDFLNLVKDVGIPLALLIVAVITLWKVWRLDSKALQAKLDEKDNRIIKLYELLARPVLEKLGNTAIAELEALNKSIEKTDPGCKK
ncbi:hypothetical protein GX441_02525 [bacterium]|nr:hypothetical protein [bacterium]